MSINPILSDYNILNFCNLNKNNPICSCVNPPNTIFAISENFFQPYYCWYSPCFSNTILKTNYIINEQKNCNSTNCKIDIGSITINAFNKITISNNCANTVAKNIFISENDYTFQPLPILLIDLKYIFLMIGLCLLWS